ncbi:hypothetical protein [Streptomyces sp. NPDC059009]|uniref:hypothetical protein n=1 Tax=Streptomyces sp. NPDC059009 TaxID=3346694 RepID=UPI0036837A44
MNSAPRSFEVSLFANPVGEDPTTAKPPHALRSETVEFTGQLGESGYPHYEGGGLQVDIDPQERTVEAATVDGEELTYGWRIAVTGPES